MSLKLSIALLIANALFVLSTPCSETELTLTPQSLLENSRNEYCKTGLLDASTRTNDGTTYFFKGKHYWKYVDVYAGIVNLRLISDDWNGVEGPIDAALTWDDGSTLLFKGDSYWRFANQVPFPGYPRKIADGFKGIPNNLDAALVWSKNGVTYFFKGDKYWRYDPKASSPTDGKPGVLNSWKGVPDNVDAAIRWEGGKTYFFKGPNYYKYDNQQEYVPNGYPSSTVKGWFDCEKQAEFFAWERYTTNLPKESTKTSEDVMVAISELKNTAEILNNKIIENQTITMRGDANLIVNMKCTTSQNEFYGEQHSKGSQIKQK